MVITLLISTFSIPRFTRRVPQSPGTPVFVYFLWRLSPATPVSVHGFWSSEANQSPVSVPCGAISVSDCVSSTCYYRGVEILVLSLVHFFGAFLHLMFKDEDWSRAPV
jgi:hypothetical protein